MTGGDILGLGVALLVVIWVIRMVWIALIARRLRAAALASVPGIDDLDAALNQFKARFPPSDARRLPLDPDDYPKPSPRRPTKPRPSSPSRRRSYRGRQR